MTSQYLTFPPAAADPLSGLSRADQLYAAAVLDRAATLLSRHPMARYDGCVSTPRCPDPVAAPPRRADSRPSSATPLCVLCAVTAAAGRMRDVPELPTAGDVARRAVADTLTANLAVVNDPAWVCVMLASRLHNGELTSATRQEIAAAAELSVCHRWMDRANYRGAIPNLPSRVAEALSRRGWYLGDVLTPAGRFAHEQHKRDLRRARNLRARV